MIAIINDFDKYNLDTEIYNRYQTQLNHTWRQQNEQLEKNGLYLELSKDVRKDIIHNPGQEWEFIISSGEYPDDTFNDSFYACLYKREIINHKNEKRNRICHFIQRRR